MAGRTKVSPDTSRGRVAKAGLSRRPVTPKSYKGGNPMKAEEMKKWIHSLRASLKRKPGDKPFAVWMAELNREEKELEERKFQRLAALGKKNR